MKPRAMSLACLLGLMLVISFGTVSTGDIIVHPSGKIIVHTNVLVNSGSFVVEPGGAVDIDLTARVTATNFNYGGALKVMSPGGSLSLGQSFRLFNAPAYSGSFSTFNLPALNPGLIWWNALGINGSLYISTPSQPVFVGIVKQNLAMRIQFLGAIGTNYSISATTNVALPRSNWTVLGPAAVISPGNFQFIDNTFTNFPKRFYQVR